VADDGELEALLTNDAVEEATPLLCGLKVTVKFALCPAAITTGNESPVIVNSELPTVAEETVTLAPVALSVPVCVPLCPTVTLPALMVAGVTLNWPWGAPVADPVSEMVRFEFEASDAMAALPLTLLRVCGAKVTLRAAL
jgi:hypothetical protein